MKRIKFLLTMLMAMLSLHGWCGYVRLHHSNYMDDITLSSKTYTSTNLSCIKSGCMTYDADKTELILDNVELTSGFNIDTDLKIILKGKNIICDSEYQISSGIATKNNLEIDGQGTGSLTIANISTGISNYKYTSYIHIHDCVIDIASQFSAIAAGNFSSRSASLTIQNAIVKATGDIRSKNKIELIDCKIRKPKGVVIEEEQEGIWAILYNNEKKSVVYEEKLIVPYSAANYDYLCFSYVNEPASVGFEVEGSLSSTPQLQYSTDGSSWNNYSLGSKVEIPRVGSFVFFRAAGKNASFSKDANNYVHFTATSDVEASGNIMSLLDATMKQTSVPAFAFHSLFKGCSHLLLPPQLPATALGNYCYTSMFMACENMEKAPDLPATTLADNCYALMFRNCRALTASPYLPATSLTPYCYNQMFSGCKNLSEVTVAFGDWNTSQYATNNWLYNVASEGYFISAGKLDTSKKGATYVPSAWKLNEAHNPLCFTAEVAGAVVKFDRTGNSLSASAYEPTLSYSTDGLTWKDYAIGQEVTLAKAGDKVFFKARTTNSTFTKETYKYINFSATAKVAGSGNVMSLLDSDSYRIKVPSCAFYGLFDGCKNLTSAPSLTATEVWDDAYGRMFAGCESLTVAPELPATKVGASSYQGMFSGCTHLTTAPSVLPAAKLSTYSYHNMFSNCTSLKYAPQIAATAITEFQSCAGMFAGCKSLVKAPSLPATTLGNECYRSMFSGCTSLEASPALNAKTLASACYWSMFEGCTSLTKAPALPATELEDFCYEKMFSGCTSLTTPPVLPATELYTACYREMFKNCTRLASAPELPATALARACYESMFEGCTQIKSIKAGFTEWTIDDNYPTKNWLKGTATEGTFYCPSSLEKKTGEGYIPTGWTVNPSHFMPENCLYFTSQHKEAMVKFNVNGTFKNIPSLLYSTDEGKNWTNYGYGNWITLTNAGDKVYFMAESQNATFNESSKDTIKFVCYEQVEAHGNIMSLLDNTCQQTSVPAYAFYRLFAGSDLVMAPELPATKLDHDCYLGMFNNTNITKAPELPATELADYCYANMFGGCKLLTEAPAKLPATTLADDLCYDAMFAGCTSLTIAPEIMATSLEGKFQCLQSMFSGCTNLREIKVHFTEWNDNQESTDYWIKNVANTGTFFCPEALEVKSDDTGSYIPKGWTVKKPKLMTKSDDCLFFAAEEDNVNVVFGTKKMTKQHPTLVYSTDNGATWYDYTFCDTIRLAEGPTYREVYGKRDHKVLNSKVYFMALNKNSSFNDEVNGVEITFKSTGKVSAHGNIMSLLDNTCKQTSVPEYAFYNLFHGCNGLTDAPELPATTLGFLCYKEMFSLCTSLTTAPELPAKELVNGCYCRMFMGCEKLNNVTVGFESWDASNNATLNWLLGVANQGTFNCPIRLAEPESRNTSTIPVGWNVSYTNTRDIVGDVNADGVVNVSDLAVLIAYLNGSTPTPFDVNCADASGDGVVDKEDVKALENIIIGE